MKHLFKKIVLLFCFCCTTILYYSCTQEKEFVNEHNHRNIDFKEKSFKEALSLPLFNNAYQKVAKKRGAFRSEDDARTALEEQFGFTIVENAPVKIITNENGTVFYTLLVDRDVKENLKFENLIIKVQNNETTAALFKYTMADKAVKIEEHESYILNIIDKELTDLNVDGKIFINAGGETCITTEVLMCNATWSGQPFVHLAEINCMIHQATYGTNSIYTTSSSICYGGTNLTNSSVVINTAGGGVPNEPIVTSPTPCRTANCLELNKIPCDELKKMKNNPLIEADIQRLKSNVNTAFREKGGSIELSTPSDPLSIVVTESTPSIEKPEGIAWPLNQKRIGINHIHKAPSSGNYAMFSIEDLIGLYKIKASFLSAYGASVNFQYDAFFVNLTIGSDDNSPSGYTYSIKVDDLVQINNLANIDGFALGNSLLETYESYGSPNSPNASHNILTYPFLQIASQYGVKLYRTKNNENKWSEIVLDSSTPSGLRLIPCNN